MIEQLGQTSYLFGLAAGILYVLTVVVGSKLWPEYTIYHAISKLTLRTSPHWVMVSTGFIIFNLLLLVHGTVIMINFSENPALRFSGWMYVVVAFAGFAMSYYPMNPDRHRDTRHGLIHRRMATLAIAGASLITISSTIGFSQLPLLRPLTTLSILLSGAIFLASFGIWMSALRRSPAFGSFQKASLGLFMLWLCWTAVTMARLPVG